MSVAETAHSVVMDVSDDEGVMTITGRFPLRVCFRRLASNISSFCMPVACPSNLLLQLFQARTLK